MNIFMKLQQTQNLTNSEKEIVAYILERPEDFLAQSAAQIARACYVSVPSIYRLCEKAGASGLNEMKVLLSAGLSEYRSANKALDFDYPIKAQQTHADIADALKEDYAETIRQTCSLIDMSEMHKACIALDKAQRISIFTSAGNVYLADNFRFQMAEIGKDVFVPTDEYEVRLEASRCTDKDLGIIISFGGRGLVAHSAAEILKANKTPILLISAEQQSLDEIADIRLNLCAQENHYNKISSFSTRLSILYILDNLYAGVFSQHYDENVKKKLEIYDTLVTGVKNTFRKMGKKR